MKFLIVLLMLCFPLLSACAQTCERNVSWKDASFLKRTSISGAISSMAEWRRYRDAEWIQLNFDGQVTSVISFMNGVKFVLSNGSAQPLDLAEISTVVESPMWSGGQNMFSKYKTPCQLKEGVNTPISRRDLNLKSHETNELLKFYGNLNRHGMRVTYSLEVQRGKSDDQFDNWYGTWEYSANLKEFPVDYDVQGWEVYRNNKPQVKLPMGKRIPISEVLEQP